MLKMLQQYRWLWLIITTIVLVGIISYFFIKEKGELPEKKTIEIKIKSNVSFVFNRADLRLAEIIKANNPDSTKNYFEQYKSFIIPYYEDILSFGNIQKSDWLAQLKLFYTDRYINELFNDAKNIYTNEQTSEIQSTYQEGFNRLKFFFPKYKTPNVFTTITGFSVANALIGKGDLCIGLEFYLGSNYKYYNKVNFLHQYTHHRLTPAYLVPNSMQVIANDLVGPEPEEGKLLDFMLYHGKTMYVAEQLLPTTPDSVLLNYTDKQTRWSYENEGEIWTWLLESNLLYNQEALTIRNIVGDGPTTKGLPSESPSRIGRFIGLQIVRNFMKNNPNTQLSQLIAIKDNQQFLEKSGYKPKK